MSGRAQQPDRPALLGRELAELSNRLRRLHGGGGSTLAAAPRAGRLRAAGRIWLQVGRETAHTGLHEVGRALGDLAVVVGQVRDPAPETLATIDALLAGLQEALAVYDAGGDPATPAGDPLWDRLRAVLSATAPLIPAPRTSPAGPPAPADEAPVLLLVDSTFLAGALQDRCEAAGLRVLAMATPEAARDHLRGPAGARWVVADNSEPGNNLKRLSALLAPGEGPPRVLLAGGGESAAAARARGDALGADGVWIEPWRVADLPPC